MEIWLVDIVILAVVALAIVGIMLWYRAKYEKEAAIGIWADIWLPNGRSHGELVRPTIDGWVKVGKGKYKLPVGKQYCQCGHEVIEHKMVLEGKQKGQVVCEEQACDCSEFQLARVIPNIRRRAKYPAVPFLGLGILQADVRIESWYLNNPEAITWADSRSTVTALDAYVHTREMEAEQTAAEITETDARQRQWVEAMAKAPDKMVLYILIGVAVIVGVVNLVHTLGL